MKSYLEMAEEMSGYVVSRLCPHRSDMKCLCGEIVEKDTVKLFASLLKDHSTSLVKQLLDDVEVLTKAKHELKLNQYGLGKKDGIQIAYSSLVAKAIQLGMVEKE